MQQGSQGRQGGGQQGQSDGGRQGQGNQGEQGQQGSGSEGSGREGGAGEGSRTGPSGQRPSGEIGGSGTANAETLRSEQTALQQGLQSLGRDLAEAGRRSAMVNQDVGSALGRATLSMQETMEGLQRSDETQRMPLEEARRAVDALNQLA